MNFHPVVHVKKEVGNIIDLLYNTAFVCLAIFSILYIILIIRDYSNSKRNYESAKNLLDETYSKLLEEYNCVSIDETANLPYIIKRTSNGGVMVKSVDGKNIEYFFQAKRCFDRYSFSKLLSDKYYAQVSKKLEHVTI